MRATLYNAQQGHQKLMEVWELAKAHLMANRRMVLELKEETRKESQSRKFHALCGDVARSKFPWAGKPRSAAQWKFLFVSGHAKATGLEVEIVPGLEGEWLNIRESTALMSIPRSASLIEYTQAFCALNKIPTVEDREVYG